MAFRRHLRWRLEHLMRCRARVERNPSGYWGRCDLSRHPDDWHALERGFYVFRWSTRWTQIETGMGPVRRGQHPPAYPPPPPPARFTLIENFRDWWIARSFRRLIRQACIDSILAGDDPIPSDDGCQEGHRSTEGEG